jgi:Uma2 family endonuclease
MGEAAMKLDRLYTYRDYLTWPEDERWELIEGIAYQMAAPSRRHQAIVVFLTLRIGNFLGGRPCKLYVAPFDVLLPEPGEDEDGDVSNVVEPDLVVYCDHSKLTRSGARGAPDLAIEVISPSNTMRSFREKFDLYERSGLREYWIVDPAGEWINRFDLGEDGRFGKPELRDPLFKKGPIASTALEGFSIDPAELFAAE